MTKHKPTITINGAPMQCDWDDPGAPVVLDNIRVRWGRDRLYDPTQPSEAILDFLDPDGWWGSDPALFGATLTITTDLGMMFRGRVDGIVLTPEEVSEDDPSIPQDVWRVQLTATDVIADLARVTPPGSTDPATPTGGSAAAIAYYGPGRWIDYNSELRRAYVALAARTVGIDTKIETKDFALTVPPGRTWDQWYKEPALSAGPDLYTLILAVQARGDEITHARYLPDTDTLTWGGFPKRASLILTYAGSIIGVAADAASGARVIPCALVSIDGSESVDSAVTHNISTFRVNEYTQSTQIASTGSPGAGFGVLIFRSGAVDVPVGGAKGYAQLISPAMISSNRLMYPDAVPTGQTETAKDFAARVVPTIAELNGKLLPPNLVFDIETNSYGTEPETALMSTYTTPGAWTFPGARYEPLTGWGPFFQLIGGELQYQQGWSLTATFAPALTSGATLTISQLVTTDPPLLNQYADTISLSTLGVVTQGV